MLAISPIKLNQNNKVHFSSNLSKDLSENDAQPAKKDNTLKYAGIVTAGIALAALGFYLTRGRKGSDIVNDAGIKINDVLLNKTKKGAKITLKDGQVEYYNMPFDEVKTALEKKEVLLNYKLRAIVRKDKNNLQRIEFYKNGILSKAVGYEQNTGSSKPQKYVIKKLENGLYCKPTRNENLEVQQKFAFSGEKTPTPFDFSDTNAKATSTITYSSKNLVETIEVAQKSGVKLSIKKVDDGYRFCNADANKEVFGFIKSDKSLTFDEINKELDFEKGVVCTKKDGVFNMFRLNDKGVELNKDGHWVGLIDDGKTQKECTFSEVEIKNIIEEVKKLCGIE